MSWIDDVVTRTTIRSAAWGNPIRDRVVQQFADQTELAARTGVVPIGGMATTAADSILWQRVGAGWAVVAMPWRTYAPLVTLGSSNVLPGSVDTYEAQWRRSFDRMELSVRIGIRQGGVIAPGFVYVSMPLGAAVNTVPIGAGLFTDTDTGLTTMGMAVTEFNRASMLGPTGAGYALLHGFISFAGAFRLPNPVGFL